MSIAPSSPPSNESETEKVDMTINVGGCIVDLSLTGVEIDCAQDIAASVIGSLLNVVQRERRVLERARLRSA